MKKKIPKLLTLLKQNVKKNITCAQDPSPPQKKTRIQCMHYYSGGSEEDYHYVFLLQKLPQ